METQKLIDIETRLAFQEDTLQTLNDIVSQQQLQIEKLEKISKTLMDRILSLTEIVNIDSGQSNEKPPHY